MASTSTDRIEGVSAELAMKAPVAVASTGNLTLEAAQTVNGVAVVAGDRVLVKDQTNNVQNGLYTVEGTTWRRARDFDGARDVTAGTLVFVQGGTIASNSVWRLTTTGTVVPGTSAITFELAQIFAADAGGFLWQFDSSTVTGEDPGSGELRFNHATVASATSIVLSRNTADANAPDVSGYVVTWDDSTSGTKGVLTIKKLGAPENFAVFNVTGTISDSEEFLSIPVANVTTGGSFSANDNLVITFVPTGNAVTADLLMTWSTENADTDQGAGRVWLKADNSVLYCDDVDNNGADMNTFVDTWDDSTSTSLRGTIKVTKNSDPSVFHILSVTGAVVSASTYSKLPVTLVTSNGSFSNGDVINVSFARTGNAGTGSFPGSSTDNAIVRFDGTGGSAVQNSGVKIDDNNLVTLPANAGIHLTEGTAPATAANTGALYVKDQGGQPELYWREESSGDEVQITSGGKLAGGGGLYTWATNMTAQAEESDVSNTGSGVVTVGTGITVSLVAGDEIVIHIGQIHIESTDTSESEGYMGIYDGTIFYHMNPERLGGTSLGSLDFPASSSDPDIITAGFIVDSGLHHMLSIPDPLVFRQKALSLSTAEKTWRLAFRHEGGNGIKINGAFDSDIGGIGTGCLFSIGVRRETS